MNHGTRHGYANLKCRCGECTKANREYQKEYLRKRVATGKVNNHGKVLAK